MAQKTIICSTCDLQEKFTDHKDAQSNFKWKLIGWSVEDNQPIMICKKCLDKKDG
jgi:hypothetical protein